MASKVTPLYAQTRILLNRWALDEAPIAKSHFVPGSTAPYKEALSKLVDEGALSKEEIKGYDRYKLTADGEAELAKGLTDREFGFAGSVIGVKTTNAILQWFRQNSDHSTQGQVSKPAEAPSESRDRNGRANGSKPELASYQSFEKTALEVYDRLNQDYNLDNLVPIYRIRRELGDRLPRQKFNEWLLEIQAKDLVQLMGSNLSDVTQDQIEDSITIPGAGARFFVKRT